MFLRLTYALWVNADHIISIVINHDEPSVDVVLASNGDSDAPKKVRVFDDYMRTVEEWVRLNAHPAPEPPVQ